MNIIRRECETPAERAQREHWDAHVRRIGFVDGAIPWAVSVVSLGVATIIVTVATAWSVYSILEWLS